MTSNVTLPTAVSAAHNYFNHDYTFQDPLLLLDLTLTYLSEF
jgi:hypothetical protein